MNKLKQLREKAGLSQARLAELSHVSQPQIARMEHPVGHKNHRNMSAEQAQRLAPALKTTVFELTGSLDAAAIGLPARDIAWIADMIEARRKH